MAKVVSVDPRGFGRGVDKHYSAVAGDGSKLKTLFCLICRSVHCRFPENHFDAKIGDFQAWMLKETVSLDQMAVGQMPPYFIWMDIEGGEMEALHGATEALQQAHFVNVEEFEWNPGHIKDIEAFMKGAGYIPIIRHATGDVLYRKLGVIPNNWRFMVRRRRRKWRIV